MSTRSNIIVKQPSGNYTNQYVHNDGGMWGVGGTLRDHYQDPEKVNALAKLGSLSWVGKEVAPPKGVRHSFNNPAPDVTVAYMRDRGERNVAATTHSSLDDALNRADNDYVYVHDENGWRGRKNYGTSKELVPLDQLKENTMEDNAAEIIDAAVDGDAARVKQLVADALHTKITDTIEAIRPAIAANIFNPEVDED